MTLAPVCTRCSVWSARLCGRGKGGAMSCDALSLIACFQNRAAMKWRTSWSIYTLRIAHLCIAWSINRRMLEGGTGRPPTCLPRTLCRETTLGCPQPTSAFIPKPPKPLRNCSYLGREARTKMSRQSEKRPTASVGLDGTAVFYSLEDLGGRFGNPGQRHQIRSDTCKCQSLRGCEAQALRA